MKVARWMSVVMLMIVVIVGGLISSVTARAQEKECPEELGQKINVSFASFETLHSLPGLDEKTAQALYAGRPYKTVQEVLKVAGMTPEQLQKIQDRIEVSPLNLSVAQLDELLILPGLNQKTAQAIYNARPYRTLDDVLRVPGMTKKKLDAFRAWVEVRKVNVNAATVTELAVLFGNNNKRLAEDIVNFCPPCEKPEELENPCCLNPCCPYEKVEDLLAIRGISETLLTQIQDFIDVKPAPIGQRCRQLVKPRKRIFLKRESDTIPIEDEPQENP